MTSSENWLRVRAVLDDALDLPPEQRPAFVASECQDSILRRQVFSILAAYEEDPSLQLDMTALELLPRETGAAPGSASAPTSWREKKGEGGMGTVYLATRADETFDKKVAIKLLKRGWGGAEEFRRFRVERQILADLEHPNIAKLLDGGSTAAGQPYFVMEFVEGMPIDEYCEQHGLAIDQRLELFLEVCSAVQFAHQNLIVHRDLKPGNILVGEGGRPRLLDFGIAKILSPGLFAEPIEETMPGVTPMTPQYASPEQIRGSAIGTRSDVYSLGVILYRLLTGLPPYRFDSRDMKAVVDAVCHQEALPPSARLRQGNDGSKLARTARLAGDLDAIVLHALAKDPVRRYPSAEQLADDLRRHLEKKPVRARGNAIAYRAGRFVQRNRFVLGAAALVFLILVGSLVVLLGQRRDLIAERNRVVSERNRAETVSSWLVELFGLPDPGRALGETVTARELLDRSNATIRTRLAAEPELLATLLGTLGETYENLGQLPEANDLLRHGDLLPEETGADDAHLAEALRRLAENQRNQFKLMPARKTATAALLHAEKAFGPDSPLAVRCRTQVGQIESMLGNLDAAAAEFDLALEQARKFPDQLALAEVPRIPRRADADPRRQRRGQRRLPASPADPAPDARARPSADRPAGIEGGLGPDPDRAGARRVRAARQGGPAEEALRGGPSLPGRHPRQSGARPFRPGPARRVGGLFHRSRGNGPQGLRRALRRDRGAPGQPRQHLRFAARTSRRRTATTARRSISSARKAATRTATYALYTHYLALLELTAAVARNPRASPKPPSRPPRRRSAARISRPC